MVRIRKIIVYLICNLTFIYAQAQHNESTPYIDSLCCDTIICDSYLMLVKVPCISYLHKTYYQYDEGFFMTYPYRDSAFFYIHKGHNVRQPFLDTSQKGIFFENDTLQCHYGICNNVFYKEIFYKERKVTISYVNIKEEDVLLFDRIISTLVFYPSFVKRENDVESGDSH